jgi:hypothetical protein
MAPTISPYYENVAEWQTDTRDDAGFAISYPVDFSTDDNYSMTPSADWNMQANGNQGISLFTLTIPKLFEPQTNFADATLTVGRSNDHDALVGCLVSTFSAASPMMGEPGDFPNQASSTVMINGTAFTVFSSTGAGAGNFYETTDYRALHAGQCYAIEYTIHSSDLGNWPSSYNLQPFNKGMLTDVLNRIVGTFKFE